MSPNRPVRLSDHFTLKEATSSEKADKYGIDNTEFSPEVFAAAFRTATSMEKVRIVLHEVAIHVNSWIRCLALNRALGSKDTSQHLAGLAVDFTAQGYGSPLEICQALIEQKDLIRFDQLILEHSWVHISFAAIGSVPRNEVLTLLLDEKGKPTGYARGLTDTKGNKI